MKVYSVPEFNSVVLVLMVAFRNAAKRANKLDLLPCINQMQEWRTEERPVVEDNGDHLYDLLHNAWRELHRAKVWLDYPMVVKETISAKEAELRALVETPVPTKASSLVKRQEAIREVERSLAAFRSKAKTLASDRTAWGIKPQIVYDLDYITREVDKISR